MNENKLIDLLWECNCDNHDKIIDFVNKELKKQKEEMQLDYDILIKKLGLIKKTINEILDLNKLK